MGKASREVVKQTTTVKEGEKQKVLLCTNNQLDKQSCSWVYSMLQKQQWKKKKKAQTKKRCHTYEYNKLCFFFFWQNRKKKKVISKQRRWDESSYTRCCQPSLQQVFCTVTYRKPSNHRKKKKNEKISSVIPSVERDRDKTHERKEESVAFVGFY